MTGRSGKRPMRPLAPQEKIDAIVRVHKGESKAAVARNLGVPESTLRGWCKNELKIIEQLRAANPEVGDAYYYEMRRRRRRRLEENSQTCGSSTTQTTQPPPTPQTVQPFNLSTTCTSLSSPSTSSYSPHSENRYTLDLSKTANDDAPAPLDLHKPKPKKKVATPKTSPTTAASDRNKAELARLSVELGLNRPEMFIPTSSTTNVSDLSNMLTAQWNQLLLQQQALQQVRTLTPPTVNANGGTLLTTVTQQEKQPAPTTTTSTNLPNDKLSLDESVRYWLNSSRNTPTSPHVSPNSGYPTSLSTPMTPPNMTTTSPMTGMTPEQNAWIFKWYKTMLASQYANAQYSAQQMTSPNVEKPILYQQLTKEKNNSENLSVLPSLPEDRPGAKNITNTKARAVLDTLLLNNNNICKEKDGEIVSQNEAVTHGEKFLKWLENCSTPSVTAMQIMQFRSLLTNVKASAERKNGGVQIKAKMRRK